MKDDSDVIGRQIGNYRIRSEINSGSFGSVYLCDHIILSDSVVAIKLLHNYMRSGKEHEEFLQEAQLLHSLHHPHILPLLDAGIHDGQPYLVMEYAAGGSLRDRLVQHLEQPLPLEEAITILTQIGLALNYAHERNVVHRDIKPENILFNATGEALLADFGIATILTTFNTKEVGRSGTPAYMAPEQFEGKISTKSDQYALGCVAYELLTGRKPFDEDGNGLDVIQYYYFHAKIEPEAPSLINPQIPSGMNQAILKAMAKQREHRYPDMLAFVDALQQNAEVRHLTVVTVHPSGEDDKEKSGDKNIPPSNNVPNNNPTIAASYPSNIFLISHHEADCAWAEWVAWQLVEEGYTVILPHWNFEPGSTIRIEMQKAASKATCTIALLSSHFLDKHRSRDRSHSMLSMSKTFGQTIVGGRRDLIPIRIDECDLKGTRFSSIMCIDLFGMDEAKARRTLITRVRKESGKPEKPPIYPHHHIVNEQPPFPNAQNEHNGTTSANQLISQINAAFSNKDWPDVIRKTKRLIKEEPLSVSPEIYHMQAVALLEEGETEPACGALETALSLTTDNKTRLSLLKVYAETLASLKQWNKVLTLANEALRLAPNDPYWLTSKQETLAKMSTPVQPKQQSIEIFFSYSHEDKKKLKNLNKFLRSLKEQAPLITWHDGEIIPGQKWLEEINKHLNSADIILLLVSQSFIDSDFCRDVEMTKALERHEAGKAHVIPIILSPSTWQTTRLKDLQALPTDGKPIDLWGNKELAYLNVFKGIQKIVDSLKSNK